MFAFLPLKIIADGIPPVVIFIRFERTCLTHRHLREPVNYLLESKLLDAKVKVNDKNF